MNKCLGCGAKLQNIDSSLEGYVDDLNNKYCERCFKITHYNEYIFNNKSNSEYLKKIEYVKKTKDLVIVTIDFLNMIDLSKLDINNPVLIVFTKKDILPRSIVESKFLSKIKCKLDVKDMLFVSSKNNYNFDLLYSDIMKYKRGKNVYVIGLTNAGKSSLINKIIKNYSNNSDDITISNLPSTTLDFLEKKIDDNLNIIDTPGLLDEGNIIFKIDKNMIKKVVPKKEINPIIFQVNRKQSILIEDILRIDLSNNNIIMYLSNSLDIKRYYKDNDRLCNLKKYNVIVKDNQDLVIKGLGFIKFKKSCSFILYLINDVNFFVRDSIV